MANFSEFNNNNYIPGFGTDMAASAFAQHLPASTLPFRGLYPQPAAPFTFTAPTQCNTIVTPRASIQTTSSIHSMVAPGMGTSWQHSIPITMPWNVSSAPLPQVAHGTASLFTGRPEFFDQQPSCSSPMRRPKRKALELPDDAPTSKVYLCTDQFANLQISPAAQQQRSNSSSCTEAGAAPTCTPTQGERDSVGWSRFQEVENRLDLELEDSPSVENNNNNVEESREGPVLKVNENMLITADPAQPLLPRKVLEEINKPCMQVILWQSPGSLIRDVVKGDITTSNKESSSSSNSEDPTQKPSLSNTATTTNDTGQGDSTMDECVDAEEDVSQISSVFESSATFPPVLDSSLPLSNCQTGLENSCDVNNSCRPENYRLRNPMVNTSNSGSGIFQDLDMLEGMDDDMQL